MKKRIDTSRHAALADIADDLDDFYNRTRRHSHLGGISPEACEAAHKRAPGRKAS